MSREVTATASPNIAFIKYWGARDLDEARPLNASISMTLSVCRTRTTLTSAAAGANDDEILVLRDGRPTPASASFARRARGHLARIRERHGRSGFVRVETANDFPADAGLASSASGFAALAVAAAAWYQLDADERELSILARASGSGSASRSVMGGYVIWPGDPADEECAARVLATEDHWPLCDVIAVVQQGAKSVSSLDGHRLAGSSPHFARRQQLLPDRLARVARAIVERDLALLGPTLEEDAIELHLVAMSSKPPIFYWNPATLAVLAAVRDLRQRGLQAWSTMDAGANVHVICEPRDEAAVAAALTTVPGVLEVIRDRVGTGPSVEMVSRS